MTQEFICKCVLDGEPSPHSRAEQCGANRQSTTVYMARQHQPKLKEVRRDGEFVRFPVGQEWNLPAGSDVGDGVITQL